ncbi:MAG: pectate lyase [Oceanospirillaceae bacterium]|nr:pectate lyase [Oceanospirillaceae bacterium]
MWHIHKWLLCSVLGLSLLACGSGGGGDAANSAESEQSTGTDNTSSDNSTNDSSAQQTAANTDSGGFATTQGGNISASVAVTVNTLAAMQAAVDAAKSGVYPVVITYTGNEDSLIAQIVQDHTVDANGDCAVAHWDDEYRFVQIKEMTAGVTILGAAGSSANFGIVVNKSTDVVIRNMKIGALGGAANDADMLRIDSSSNVWIDHNELFAVNNECNGSPDGDLTFEGALDIKKDSHNITVSYNYIHDVKKVGLDGSSNTDIAGGREITYHHNYYENVNSRLPLQRGGWTHFYNNFYSHIKSSGINVRQLGYALIEYNWFENSANPITCRFDSSNCGYWQLRGNNLQSTEDNATYGISWSSVSAPQVNADNWQSTADFPITLPYSYTPQSIVCVKNNLAQVAGAGHNMALLDCE